MRTDNELEDLTNHPQTKQEQEVNQQAYYWHCLKEFHAILKGFGNAKVLADLKKIKD